MPKLTKKHYKKRKTKQKKGKRGRRTKRIYKKMKGGVSFNPVFHAGSLPSNTYYDLNKYEPDLQRSPELVDARLLPTMKGGGQYSGFDHRAYDRDEYLKNIRDSEFRGAEMSRFKRNVSNTTQRVYNRGKDLYRKFNKKLGRPPTRGEQEEIDAAKDARKEKIEEDYVEFDGKMLYENFKNIDKKDPLKEKAVFYSFDDDYINKIELGKLSGISDRVTGKSSKYFLKFIKEDRQRRYLAYESSNGYGQESENPDFQINMFYVHKDDLKNQKYNEDKSQQPGGKKRRKSRRKRKMKGGSLIGTDILTGLNTTDTNSVLAFGTTGGTKYMLNELQAGPVESGPYLSSRTDVNPNLA